MSRKGRLPPFGWRRLPHRRVGMGQACGPATIFPQLVVRLVPGFREWREARDHPMVQRCSIFNACRT